MRDECFTSRRPARINATAVKNSSWKPKRSAQLKLFCGHRLEQQRHVAQDRSCMMTIWDAKELELRGSFRFHDEFFTAVALMRAGRLDVKPLITHTFPLRDAIAAFNMASDRSQAIKAQIAFS
jgi:hypothetical protein